MSSMEPHLPTSRLPHFYDLPLQERLAQAARAAGLSVIP